MPLRLPRPGVGPSGPSRFSVPWPCPSLPPWLDLVNAPGLEDLAPPSPCPGQDPRGRRPAPGPQLARLGDAASWNPPQGAVALRPSEGLSHAHASARLRPGPAPGQVTPGAGGGRLPSGPLSPLPPSFFVSPPDLSTFVRFLSAAGPSRGGGFAAGRLHAPHPGRLPVQEADANVFATWRT